MVAEPTYLSLVFSGVDSGVRSEQFSGVLYFEKKKGLRIISPASILSSSQKAEKQVSA
jgi:hypothetical protein